MTLPSPLPLQVAPFTGLPGIAHGFFTRQGGVSRGCYASLNCGLGSGDDALAVATNRALVAQNLGCEANSLVTVWQQHGTGVIPVTHSWAPHQGPPADALVTRVPGVALGILTADCAPLLLADPKAAVIGAAHAGWKGARAGVAAATIAAMVALGARVSDIQVAIGPLISQENYAIGPEFHAEFLAHDPANARYFKRLSAQYHFDLAGFLVHGLQALGVGSVTVEGSCTLSDPLRFFSYRRACLAGEGDYGRMLSSILLR